MWTMRVTHTSGIEAGGTSANQCVTLIQQRVCRGRLGKGEEGGLRQIVKHLLRPERQLGRVALTAAGLSALHAVPTSATGSLSSGPDVAQMSSAWSALSRLFSYSNFVHAVSGSVGSFVALSVFFPLDTARTRLQVDDHREAKHSPQVIAEILSEEGLQGLYRGWGPVISALCCSNFVYFYAYNGLKAMILGEGRRAGAVSDLLLAFTSGVINVLVTTPLWVANTRLKLQGAKLKTEDYKNRADTKYSGILDCLLKVWKREGLKSLWAGTLPSLVLASNPAMVFMIYELLKRYFQRQMNVVELSGFLYFVIGAVAKTIATVVTYPLQVLQSRLRAGLAHSEKSQSILQHFMLLIRSQGLGFLYKGMEAKLLQTVLTASLMFLTYEKIASFIFALMGTAPKPAR